MYKYIRSYGVQNAVNIPKRNECIYVGIHSATVQFAEYTVVIPVPQYGATSTCSQRSPRFEEVVSEDDDNSDSSSDWTWIVSRNKKIKTRLIRSPQGT